MWTLTKNTTKKPEGEVLLELNSGRRVVGYWDKGYWWYENEHHSEYEVNMWIEMSKVLLVTKWLECVLYEEV